MSALSFVVVGVIFGLALAQEECWDQAKLKKYIPTYKECGLKKEDAENSEKLVQVYICLAKKENLLEGNNVVIKKVIEYEESFALDDKKNAIGALVRKCSDSKESAELMAFLKCYRTDISKMCKKDLNFLD